MKKKILALLTALAMLVSVAPVVFAEGEATEDTTTTYIDAYTQFNAIDDAVAYTGDIQNTSRGEKALKVSGNTKNATYNLAFGDKTPEGIIIRVAFSGAAYGGLILEVGDDTNGYTQIAKLLPTVNNSYDWPTERYYEFDADTAALLKGNKTFKITGASGGTYGFLYSMQFYTSDMTVTKGNPIFGNAYESLNFAIAGDNGDHFGKATGHEKWRERVNVDFGEGAENMVFEIKRTNSAEETATLCDIEVKIGSTVIATIPSVSVAAGAEAVQYAKVSNLDKCVGETLVELYMTEKLTNADQANLDLKFIKTTPASPYAELLSESFTGEKNFGLVDFGELGAKSVTVAYNGSGLLSINGEATATLEADDTTATINLDVTKFKGIQNLTLLAAEGLSVSSVIFNEMTFTNPFDKDTVNAVYIGAAVTETADWTLAIEEKLAANSTEYYGTTFTNTDITLPSTDAGKLDLVKSVPNGDIIFIQESDIAESLVKAYAALSTVPYVIVVGTATYADTYGIKAITADGEGLGANETYQKPVAIATRNPYTGIAAPSYDETTVSNPTTSKEFINGFNSWGDNNVGYQYKNVNFSKGAGTVTLDYAEVVNKLGAIVDVRIDGYTGTTIASFEKTSEANSGRTTATADILVPVEGIHDVYLVDRNPAVSYGSTFGNIYSVTFTSAKSYDEIYDISAETATLVEGNIYLDATTTATFEKMADISVLASLPANIAATGTGVVKVKNGENVLATIDLTGADGNFNKVLGTIAEDAAAATDLTLVYEGDGHCYIKSINLKTLDILTTTFDSTNYSDKLSTVSVSNSGQINGLACTPDHPNKYIMWSNVDFGDEAKMLDLSAIIGYSRVGTGEALNLYVDEATDENLFAQLVTSSTVSEWGNGTFTRTAPLTAYPTGIHDVIIKVQDSNAANNVQDNRFINLYSFNFAQTDSTDAIRVVEQEINAMVIANSVETRYLRGMNTVVSFMDGTDIPDSYLVVAALYDSTNKLIDIDVASKTTVENGLNGASVELSFEGLADGTYTYKYFFWDGATLKPISTNSTAVTLPTVK